MSQGALVLSVQLISIAVLGFLWKPAPCPQTPTCPGCPTCPACPGAPATPATPATPSGVADGGSFASWIVGLEVLCLVVAVVLRGYTHFRSNNGGSARSGDRVPVVLGPSSGGRAALMAPEGRPRRRGVRGDDESA